MTPRDLKEDTMVMKIGPAGGAKPVENTKKSGKASSTGGVFFAYLSETEDAAAPNVGATAGVGGIEALLMAQAVDGATDGEGRKKRAAARGNDILDRLEDLRAAILTGSVPKSKLIELAQMLRDKRESGLDDEMNAILDDIELRAEVELAKLSQGV